MKAVFAIYLDVLKSTSFRNLWLGQVLSQIAFNMMSFVLLVRVYTVSSGQSRAVSLLLLSISLPAILLSPIAGVYADKLDRKFIMVSTNVLRAMIFFLFAHVSQSVRSILTFSFFLSCISQFFAPAEAATIPAVVKKQNLLAANSLFTLTVFSSTLFGYVLAGPFLRFFNDQGIFIFMGILLAAAAAFVATIPSSYGSPASKPVAQGFASSFREIIKELMEGISYIIQNRQTTLLPSIQITITQVLIFVIVVIAPGFAEKLVNIDIKDASLLLIGPTALGMITTILVIGKISENISRQRVIISGILLAGSSLTILSFLHYLPIAMILLFMLGVGNTLIAVPAHTELQESLPEELRGRVYGVLMTMANTAALMPVIASGWVADTVGIFWVMITIGLATTSFGIYTVYHQKGWPWMEETFIRSLKTITRPLAAARKENNGENY